MTLGPEEQTIRDVVLPRLQASGWVHVVREYPITDQRREVVGGRVRRSMPLRADLVLLHPVSGHPLAAVEVKKARANEHDGVTQAKDYGTRLGLPLVYATNGPKIIEIDLRNGIQGEVADFRTATELWSNFVADGGLDTRAEAFFTTPYSRALTDLASGRVKQMRYYQHRAAQAVLRAIARGDRRVLAVLATGSGKSMLAAQIVHVLWENRWPRGVDAADPRPRVLYLADRDVLVKDPLNRFFTPIFGLDEVHRIRREPQTHKRIYFALYQAIERFFTEFDRDFFDLVIIDECHRGSAGEDNEWRRILEHFSGAVQLGLTATPRADGEADNLEYFGSPAYTYSLREGIEDGFLAPFEVIRAALSIDVDGVQVADGVLDADGEPIPAGTYGVSQFERTLVVPERTQEAAAFVSHHLERTDRMAKTIVFCVDQDHAARLAAEIGNRNSDLVAAMPNWAQRITSDEGDRGAVLLEQFQDGESAFPVVVTSSDMLTTGVDVPSVRNIVFFTAVRSTARFKQMLGRGTRLDDDRGKEFFTVIDFTGATARFADADFDGLPVRVVELSAGTEPAGFVDEAVAAGSIDQVEESPGEFVAEPGGEFEVPPEPIEDDVRIDDIQRRGRRHVLAGREVYLLGSTVHVVDTEGGLRLRVVRIEDWVRDRVLDLGFDVESLRRQWADAVTRGSPLERLQDVLPLGLDELAAQLGHPDADPLDLLLHLGFGARLRSRADRAARVTLAQREFLDGFGPEARLILDRMLEKYVEHGPQELAARVLQVTPFSDLGSVTELAARFGGAVGLQTALAGLNESLYAS